MDKKQHLNKENILQLFEFYNMILPNLVLQVSMGAAPEEFANGVERSMSAIFDAALPEGQVDVDQMFVEAILMFVTQIRDQLDAQRVNIKDIKMRASFSDMIKKADKLMADLNYSPNKKGDIIIP